jgi:hypothetical protein
MRTKDLIDLAGNPDFISGIYNYCDRWCERCPFSSRCLVYAMEAEDTDDLAGRDINNAEFWDKLRSIFEQTKEMIVAWAEEEGIDLNSAVEESEIEKHRQKSKDVRDHELSAAAKAYAILTNEWFDQELVEVQGADDRSTPVSEEPETSEMAYDATQVIRWYQYLIAAKTMRALMAAGEDEYEEERPEDLPNTSDGSIKVALIAIDRSISAWRMMQLALADRADSVIPLLLSLERLRLNLETTFPLARDFVRPGFDENPDCAVN